MPRVAVLLALCVLLFVTDLSGQMISFEVSPQRLHVGDKGTLSATLRIPAKKHQYHDPLDPFYFDLEASHPDLSFEPTVYPQPDKISAEGLWDYTGEVVLTRAFTVIGDSSPGNILIKPVLLYSFCLDSGACEPPEEYEGSVELARDRIESAPQEILETEAEEPAPDEIDPAEKELLAVEAEEQRIISEILSKGMGTRFALKNRYMALSMGKFCIEMITYSDSSGIGYYRVFTDFPNDETLQFFGGTEISGKGSSLIPSSHLLDQYEDEYENTMINITRYISTVQDGNYVFTSSGDKNNQLTFAEIGNDYVYIRGSGSVTDKKTGKTYKFPID